jgi:P4 family phage/plasmid primase-like protien
LFYPDDQDYDTLTSKYRTLYWTTQFFTAKTANIEKPYDFDKHRISEQIGGREDTVYHSFFLDLDKAKGKDIQDNGVIEWLEKALNFFADKLTAAGVKSFGLAFSGGGVYCVLHPRLGLIDRIDEEDYTYRVEIWQRAFDLFIGDTAAEFFKKYPEAIEWVKFDKLNNDSKRQVKTILSIHKKYPYVVIPLDKHNPKIYLKDASLPISDETIEKAKNWLVYQDDIIPFGNLLAPWTAKAQAKTKKTHGTRTVTLESEEVSEEDWAPCIRNIITKRDLKSGAGASRALGVLASYMRHVGVPEEKAFRIFQQKADEWSAETSNIFESWYGCEHLHKPECFVPSCEKIRTDGTGYPTPELGELKVCTPDEHCERLRSPIYYHKKKQGRMNDVVFKDDEGRKKVNHEMLISNIFNEYNFKTLEDTEELLVFDEGIYRNGVTCVKAYLENALGSLTNKHLVSEIIGHLQRGTYTSREKFNNGFHYIPVSNGILDLDTQQLESFDPEMLYTFRLPTDYIPSAGYSHIEAFFKEVLYKEDIKTMQEIFGYALYMGYPAHKAMWWLGAGRNGKTTAGSLLTALVGTENTAGVPLSQLDGGHRFAVARLFGKLVNIVAEPETKTAMQTPTFKAATGGDTIFGEWKNVQEDFPFVNFAKFVIYANHVPKIKDSSFAFWERVIAIEFPHTFTKDEAKKDHYKTLITQDTLAGLLNWALVGLKRLQENGWEFTESQTQINARGNMRRQAQPVKMFIDEWAKFDNHSDIPKARLFDAFKIYCDVYGLLIPDEGEFTRELKRNVNVEQKRLNMEDWDISGRVLSWRGLKLNNDIDMVFRDIEREEEVNGKNKGENERNIEIKVQTLPDYMMCQTCHTCHTFSLLRNCIGEKSVVLENKAQIPLYVKMSENTPDFSDRSDISKNKGGDCCIGRIGDAIEQASKKEEGEPKEPEKKGVEEDKKIVSPQPPTAPLICVCGKPFDTIEVLQKHQSKCKKYQAKQDKEAREEIEKLQTPDEIVRLRVVKEIFVSLELKKRTSEVSIEEIINVAEVEGVNREQAEEAIRKLKLEGIVFSPKKGVVEFAR